MHAGVKHPLPGCANNTRACLLVACRLQLELKSSGAVRVLPDPVGSTQPSASGTSASSYPGLDAFQPQWLLLSEGNDWRKRVQVAQRFVHAARVVIVRNRAQARLRKLRALAGDGQALLCECWPTGCCTAPGNKLPLGQIVVGSHAQHHSLNGQRDEVPMVC